jgi:hypothetical protein
MTTIQVFALCGVFLIGAIFGGYAMFRFFRLALRWSKVVGMEVGTCEDPECRRMHLRINTMNATESLGITTTTMEIDPGLAQVLIVAFNTPEAKASVVGVDTPGDER